MVLLLESKVPGHSLLSKYKVDIKDERKGKKRNTYTHTTHNTTNTVTLSSALKAEREPFQILPFSTSEFPFITS